MKILHVIDSTGVYGAEVMLLNLMAEQLNLGIEPMLASIGKPGQAEKPLESEARRRGLAVEPFRMQPGPSLKGLLAMREFARQKRVDVIHSHGYKGNILFGFLPARWRGAPLVATVHGWARTGGLNRMLFYEWLDAQALRFVDRIVLVNEAMKDYPKFRGSKRVRTEVVANGLALTPDLLEQQGLDPRVLQFCTWSFVIGAVGRLSEEKGFGFLLEAVSLLVQEGLDLRLVILGEGDCRTLLEKRVRELGLESRVLMPGYLPSASRYLPFFQAFVISSLTEGLPMVLLEAMRAGIPIVSSRVGGVPEALEQGKAGILVAPRSAVELARGIGRIITDGRAAAGMAAAAGKIVQEKYSARAMATRYSEVYAQLLKSRQGRNWCSFTKA